MTPRSNLENTWLPLITQKAKLLGKQYSSGEMRTLANEFVKRLPQNVDNKTFNEILNKTFADFDALKARHQPGQIQQQDAVRQIPTVSDEPVQTPEQMSVSNERRFESDV